MMRITILTYGSRGDVQPYLALAVGLQRAGHTVRFAAPGVFADFVREYGIDFAPLAGNPADLVKSLVEHSQRDPIFGPMRAIMGYALPIGLDVLDQCRAACADADLIVHAFLLTVAGHQIATELGIPDVGGEMFPVFASTGAFPALTFPDLPLGMWYNRLTHQFFTSMFWQGNKMGYQWVRSKRRDLLPLAGSPFNRHKPIPLLYAVSPHVITPAAWPAHVHVTGYWFLDSPAWTPPAELVAFLEAGSPPIYIGFGSTLDKNMARVTEAVVTALRQAGQRGILLGGWAGVGDQGLGIRDQGGDDLYVLDSAPHDWLFPRMAVVVHHGGAGTTAAGLRAGIPSILTSFSSDQPYWGKRIERLGVGVNIPYRRISADSLTQAIQRAVNDTEVRERAAQLGEIIRAEDGVERAVEIIEQIRSAR